MKRKRAKIELVSVMIREEVHYQIGTNFPDVAQYLIEHISDADWEKMCLHVAEKVIVALDEDEEKNET